MTIAVALLASHADSKERRRRQRALLLPAERYNLESRSFGKEPYRRVKIFAR